MKKTIFAAALVGAAVLTACGGNQEAGITMGSLSEFDSLSYAIGANIGNGVNYEMKDIPFDYAAIEKGIREGALDKATETHDASVEKLRDYFMSKRGERAQAVAKQRAEADSVRFAAGDSTKMEYGADPSMFETEEERESISYAFGNDVGFNLRNSHLPLQIVWVCEAIQNVNDKSPKMDEDAAQQYLQYYFMVKRPAENKEASEKWLSKIEKKSGVKKTESGLLYKIQDAGDQNVMAKDPRDVVKVHYTGRLRSGKVFDSSHFANRDKEQQEMMRKQNPDAFDEKGNLKEGDKEIDFPLNRVIPGWTEGMQLIGKGGKITLWIPSDLAYGQRGDGGRGTIGPNEALEFEIELIDVTPYEEPAPAADSTESVPATEIVPAK